MLPMEPLITLLATFKLTARRNQVSTKIFKMVGKLSLGEAQIRLALIINYSLFSCFTVFSFAVFLSRNWWDTK